MIAEEDEAPQQAPSARGSAFPIPASSLRRYEGGVDTGLPGARLPALF